MRPAVVLVALAFSACATAAPAPFSPPALERPKLTHALQIGPCVDEQGIAGVCVTWWGEDAVAFFGRSCTSTALAACEKVPGYIPTLERAYEAACAALGHPAEVCRVR